MISPFPELPALEAGGPEYGRCPCPASLSDVGGDVDSLEDVGPDTVSPLRKSRWKMLFGTDSAAVGLDPSRASPRFALRSGFPRLRRGWSLGTTPFPGHVGHRSILPPRSVSHPCRAVPPPLHVGQDRSPRERDRPEWTPGRILCLPDREDAPRRLLPQSTQVQALGCLPRYQFLSDMGISYNRPCVCDSGQPQQ